MADHLPRDVIVLILLRLPTKSVIRLRLACKSWLSLISSTHFMLLYLRTNKFSRTLVHRLSCIITFDMSTESFGEIQLPENLAPGNGIGLRLVVVEESLGVIYSNRSSFRRRSSSYEIWVMKEYKNPASWTMVYNMHYPDGNAGIAMGLTDNGSLITLSGQRDLKIYDQEGCYNVFASGSEDIVYVERYQESLDLLDVGMM